MENSFQLRKCSVQFRYMFENVQYYNALCEICRQTQIYYVRMQNQVAIFISGIKI